MEIAIVEYDHPDAAKMIAAVQQVYVARYGDVDITPVEPAEFAPPRGLFLVGYVDGVPVACGGWRAHDGPAPEYRVGDAEMKRLYVPQELRGRGYAKQMLAEVERTAGDAGRTRMILETGTRQPEAIALYRANGYTDIPRFGAYRNDPMSVCLAKELSGVRP